MGSQYQRTSRRSGQSVKSIQSQWLQKKGEVRLKMTDIEKQQIEQGISLEREYL